jgi:hypothetical protein
LNCCDRELDVDTSVMVSCCQYSSGGRSPDHDAADAFVALCTAILHAEGGCRIAVRDDGHLKVGEGGIWVPKVVRHEGF